VTSDGRGNDLFGQEATEFWANGRGYNRRGGPVAGLGSPETMLSLPVEDAPVVDTSAAQTWVTPYQFGGLGNGIADDTSAIQQAVNAAPVVFLPRTGQSWRIRGTISLPPGFKRLLGAQSVLSSINASGAVLSVASGTQPIAIEHLRLDNVGVTHAGARPVVLNQLVGLAQYDAVPGAMPVGRVFLENVSFNRVAIAPGQSAWGRHLVSTISTEGGPAKITNRGGQLFILGYFADGPGTTLRTEQQGLTEVMGASHFGNGGADPRFVVVDGSMTVGLPRGQAFSSILETRGAQSWDGGFGFSEGPGGWTADAIALWSDASLWRHRQEVILDAENVAPADFAGSWQRVPTFLPDGGVNFSGRPGGFLGTSFSFAVGGTQSSIRYTFALPESGMYQIAARWPASDSSAIYNQNRGVINYTFGGGSLQANQTQLGGGWVQVGTMYPLAIGQFTLDVSPSTATTTIVADAIRLKKVQ
jgi:hypothetical protein